MPIFKNITDYASSETIKVSCRDMGHTKENARNLSK